MLQYLMWAELRTLRKSINKRMKGMEMQLDAISTAVNQAREIDAQAMALVVDLKAKLDAALAAIEGGDQAALQALADSLSQRSQELQATLNANTPV